MNLSQPPGQDPTGDLTSVRMGRTLASCIRPENQILIPADVDVVALDFDGTTAHTRHLHLESFCRGTEERLNRAIDRSDWLKIYDASAKWGGHDLETAKNILQACRDRGWSVSATVTPADLVEAKLSAFERNASELMPELLEGIPALVDMVLEAKRPLILCSNGSGRIVRPVLEHYNLAARFSHFLVGEDFPPDCRKPDRRSYLLVAERLGVSPERIFAFEDSATGVAAAWRNGMYVAACVPERLQAKFDAAVVELDRSIEPPLHPRVVPLVRSWSTLRGFANASEC